MTKLRVPGDVVHWQSRGFIPRGSVTDVYMRIIMGDENCVLCEQVQDPAGGRDYRLSDGTSGYFAGFSREYVQDKELVGHLDLTPQEQGLFRVDLPVAVMRGIDWNWGDLRDVSMKSAAYFLETHSDQDPCEVVLPVSQLYLVPSDKRQQGERFRTHLIKSVGGFTAAELIYFASEVQARYVVDRVAGGFRRSGFKRKVPVYAIGDRTWLS